MGGGGGGGGGGGRMTVSSTARPDRHANTGGEYRRDTPYLQLTADRIVTMQRIAFQAGMNFYGADELLPHFCRCLLPSLLLVKMAVRSCWTAARACNPLTPNTAQSRRTSTE